MSGRVVLSRQRIPSSLFSSPFSFLLTLATLLSVTLGVASSANAQQRREREPNAVYSERRARLAAQVDGPVVLFGYTGREESSPAYVFAQEDNFYYLTGHNEEGAALVIVPKPRDGSNGPTWDEPREILFLPPRNPQMERWNGLRMGADDPGIAEKTGFAVVRSFADLRATVEKLTRTYTNLHTIQPYKKEKGGYPHEKEWTEWLTSVAPQVKLNDVRARIGAMRQIKSPKEIEFLTRAIDLSVDAHLEALRMMRPGLYEYQVAAKMVDVHAMGGAEAEGYAPIVGAGFNSTVLHYDKLSKRMDSGDVVVLDVGAQYAGYSADITRTFPASGKFTPRQREIYDIVLGAQYAALAACKPGASFAKDKPDSLFRIAYDYINSRGKDQRGERLGKYFIHGLGHHIGLDVHDAGDPYRPFEPGMVVTIEPGVYIPEENLGVRIEDDVLVTSTGCKVLSERLPRTAAEIERIMANAARERVSRSD